MKKICPTEIPANKNSSSSGQTWEKASIVKSNINVVGKENKSVQETSMASKCA